MSMINVFKIHFYLAQLNCLKLVNTKLTWSKELFLPKKLSLLLKLWSICMNSRDKCVVDHNL